MTVYRSSCVSDRCDWHGEDQETPTAALLELHDHMWLRHAVPLFVARTADALRSIAYDDPPASPGWHSRRDRPRDR